MREPPEGKRFWAAACASAALVAGAVFGPHLAGDFVWDDASLLAQNPDLRSPGHFAHLVTSPIEPGASVYRPLSMATFWLEAHAGGLTVAGARALDVVLHVGVAIAVLALVRRLGARPLAAVIAAGLFLVHPSATEPVMWLNGRHDTLGALLALGALLLILPREDEPRPSPARSLGAAALAFLALLCKESFVVLPVLVALDEGRRLYASRARPTRANAIPPALLLAPVILVFALRRALGIPGNLDAVPLASLPRAFGTVVGHYALQLLSFDDGATVQTFAPWGPARAWAVLVVVSGALAALAVACRRGSKAAGIAFLGVAWFAVSLAPAAYAVAVAGQYANRYAYFPAVGLAIALAAGVDRLLSLLASDAATRAAVACAAIFGALLAFRTSREAARWHDEAALFGADVDRLPDDGRALFHFAVDLQRRKGCATALPLFARAADLAPGYVRAWHNVAGCLLRLGRYADAVEPARRAAALDPGNPRRHYNLGLALAGAGDLAAGEACFERALALDPGFAPAARELDAVRARASHPTEGRPGE